MQLYGAMLHFQTNGGILALANGKEIQELDITPLLDMPSSVMEDDCELDLLGLDRFESTYFVAIQFSCTYTFFLLVLGIWITMSLPTSLFKRLPIGNYCHN